MHLAIRYGGEEVLLLLPGIETMAAYVYRIHIEVTRDANGPDQPACRETLSKRCARPILHPPARS